jgi:hypothetical protein
MLRRFFEWVSGKPKEWLSKPRLVPESYRVEPDDSSRWVMSQEYADAEYRNRRYYLAAVKEDANDSYWRMTLVSRDLKHGDEYFELSRRQIADDPSEVLQYMQRFEESCREKEFIALPQSRSTYRKFANNFGQHFDGEGHSFTVDTQEPIAREVFMSRESLEKVFHNEAAKKPVLDTWENIYAYIVNGQPVKGIAAEDLTGDKAWPVFAGELEAMAAKLHKLPDYLAGEEFTERQKQKTLENMIEYVIVDPTRFETSDKMRLAQHMADASILVGLLRAGAALYDAQFSAGLDLSPEKLAFVGLVGKVCANFAEQRFNLSESEAKPIANIISQGDDPYGKLLPAEVIVAKYPAPKAEPEVKQVAAAAQPAPASKPKKNKP